MTDFPIGTLILPEPAGAEAWRDWRAGLDIDTLSYECLQTLPALAPSLARWLVGDACAARIQGIVKMAWSRNQIRLQRAVELHDTLLRAGVTPVAFIGPLAWSLLAREEGSIRTIPDLTLLVPRQHLFTAISALTAQGWELRRSQPDNDTFEWSSNLGLAKGEETLHLHWRLFPAAAPDAAGFEAAMLEGLRTVAWKGHEFQVLSAEADLLHRLTDRPSWDPVPWRADVLMMSFAGVDWARLRRLADRFPSFFEPVDVVGRLMELRRDWGLPIPEIAPARSSPRLAEPTTSARLTLAGLRGKLGRLGRHLWRA